MKERSQRPPGPPPRDATRRRSILHVDLDPFFVSVERSLAPDLRGRPVVIGPPAGFVAAASAEALALGVRPGVRVQEARALCPDAVFRPGDLETYARVGQQVAAVLDGVSRRVERHSADEATLDLTPEGLRPRPPAVVAEGVKDELQRQLGLDASFGLAGSRLAARAASRYAKPRGLLIVLPGYEHLFLETQPVGLLPDIPPHIERWLTQSGIQTIGDLLHHDEASLGAVVGGRVAPHLLAAARCESEAPIPVSAAPTWLLEERRLHEPISDPEVLADIAAGMATACCRRLRPHDLHVGAVSVEAYGLGSSQRRHQELSPPTADESALRRLVAQLVAELPRSLGRVQRVDVRFSRLASGRIQPPLFPEASGLGSR